MHKRHVNALNIRSLIAMVMRGELLPHGARNLLRHWQHRQNRFTRYRTRNAKYPYSSARQHARYGRQVREGRLKVENGLVLTSGVSR